MFRFPMAGPSGAILQGTRRGSRYWALRRDMQAAIAAASGQLPAPIVKDVEAPEAVGILEARHSCPSMKFFIGYCLGIVSFSLLQRLDLLVNVRLNGPFYLPCRYLTPHA